jgi:hypothetical protein
MSVSMAAPIAHTVIRSEDKSRILIIVEVVDQFRDLSDSLVHNLDVVQILSRVRPVRMTAGVQTKKMQEEDKFVLSQFRIELWIRLRILEQLLHAIEDPEIQLRSIFAEILEFVSVRRILDSSRNSASAEHGQYIWTAPAPCMPAPIEHAVEVDRVQLPAGCDGRHILVQACDQGYMSGS